MILGEIFGIKLVHVIGGAAGGATRWILLGGSIGFGFTSIFAGCLSAAYLTPITYFAIVRYFPTWADTSTEHVTCYIVGLTGLIFCQGVTNVVTKWKDDPSQIPVIGRFFAGKQPPPPPASPQAVPSTPTGGT